MPAIAYDKLDVMSFFTSYSCFRIAIISRKMTECRLLSRYNGLLGVFLTIYLRTYLDEQLDKTMAESESSYAAEVGELASLKV